ncbi:DsbA family protein [Ornithinimicrobium sp. Y1847]|uniref:DsbA family protein n=1 Tax=Ornithinimicrobium sp. Y1847 TaxID=3405419 RepID=UPI003B683CEB
MSQYAPPPQDHRPADDSKVASIAWAVAAIVVALVVAFIAWLAMSDRGDSPSAAPAETGTVAPEQGAGTEGSDSGEGAAPDGVAQTPSPEVQEMLLELQRRDADDPMAVGDVDAPVVMIEYADYRCPYCARFHLDIRPELQSLVDDGTLRIEFRDLVLFDEPSQLAAVAARAAAEQGGELGLEFQKEVFALSREGHAEIERQDMIDIAEQIGVPDMELFEEDLDGPRLSGVVTNDTQEALSLGVNSTPTFLINRVVVQGAYEAPAMIRVIEEQKALAEEGATS